MPAPMRALGAILRPHRGSLVLVVALQVPSALAGLAPFLAVIELGRVLLAGGQYDGSHVWTVITLGVAGLLVRILLGAASSGLAHVVDGHLQLALRKALALRLGHAPLGWYSRRGAGELNQIVQNDVNQLHALLAHTPGEITSPIVVPAVSAVYLFAVDWRLTLIVLIPVALGLGLRRVLMSERRRKDEAAVDAAMGRIGASAVEFVEGIAVVKTFGQAGKAHISGSVPPTTSLTSSSAG